MESRLPFCQSRAVRTVDHASHFSLFRRDLVADACVIAFEFSFAEIGFEPGIANFVSAAEERRVAS